MNVAKFYAHTLEGEPPAKWQGLEEHLLGVAKLAASFAGAFGSASWGYLAGLWHDLGKYQIEFQQRRELGQADNFRMITNRNRSGWSNASKRQTQCARVNCTNQPCRATNITA